MIQAMFSGEESESQGTRAISPEILGLLGLSEKQLERYRDLHSEKMLLEIMVDAQVAYGKTRSHIEKVSRISLQLCREMALDSIYCALLEKASLIYDIGNLSIDPELYRKDNKLSFEEFEIVKQHTVIGQEVLLTQGEAVTDMAARISAEHHEWYDGSGYPHGLKGEKISIEGRIVALADTAAALSSPRYGRIAIDFDRIQEHIAKRSRLQFDPKVVEFFMANSIEMSVILESG